MTPLPVSPVRIKIAKEAGFVNVEPAALACRIAHLPFFAALALLSKESADPAHHVTGGANIWGQDHGSVTEHLHGKPVVDVMFLDYLIKVMNGGTPNGVGPTQVTWAGLVAGGHRDGGYYRLMAEQNLRPWVPKDNMVFGFGLLAQHYSVHHDWVAAGEAYNGLRSYGVDLAKRVSTYKRLLRVR